MHDANRTRLGALRPVSEPPERFTIEAVLVRRRPSLALLLAPAPVEAVRP
jgi:hypothetical protein